MAFFFTQLLPVENLTRSVGETVRASAMCDAGLVALACKNLVTVTNSTRVLMMLRATEHRSIAQWMRKMLQILLFFMTRTAT
jgi:hypothetical protein